MRFSLGAIVAGGLALAGIASAQIPGSQVTGTIDDGPFPDDLNGSNFTYPWPVKVFRFTNQFQKLEMAFMDVQPKVWANGKTIVMLHGKNFCGPTWEDSIRLLSGLGYRVIAPDQIGFCKSTKPETYQFSLNQLAMNTKGLVDALGIDKHIVMGHSLGGMLTTRYGLQYPDSIEKLILVDPVGLEDYVEKGVPYITVDQNYKSEAAQTYESIKGYEQAVYYVGEWKESYATWVRMLVNIYYGSEREKFLRNQGQIVDLVLTSPVSHYFGDLQPKTLLIVGDKDKTAIGAQWAPPEVAAKLGHFDVLGPEVAAQIPNSRLHQFANLGHAPQLSEPDQFHSVVLNFLCS